jgi:hypothetical protein
MKLNSYSIFFASLPLSLSAAYADVSHDPLNIPVSRLADSAIVCLETTGFSRLNSLNETAMTSRLSTEGRAWLPMSIFGTEWFGYNDFLVRFGSTNAGFAKEADDLVKLAFGADNEDARTFVSNAPFTLESVVQVSPKDFFQRGSGEVAVYNADFGKRTTFSCLSNNRSDLTKSRSWATRDLLMLEPRNWPNDALEKIAGVESASIFLEMINKAELRPYFDALSERDAIVVPSNASITRALSKDYLKFLLEPEQVATLRSLVLSHVIPGGWSIGDYGQNSREFVDANGDLIQIGIRELVPGSTSVTPQGFYSLINGKNNGIAIDKDKSCDFDWQPVPTKKGVIYPSLCLRTGTLANDRN